ncbi:MAG: LuxR family transcriptional regulator [Nevskia sp.]|nr:LuxR family transcriptional regulator [Nevskia sp.]
MDDQPPIDRIEPVDRFVGHLYRSALSVPPESYRCWALQQWREIVPFDGALWGSGTVRRWAFHTAALVGLPEEFPRTLEATRPINPLVPAILASLDEPVDMRNVLGDAEFFRSEIYQRCFKPFGITRVLSTGHLDARSGLYSLLSIYRRDRSHPFTEAERVLQRRASFHLFNTASHAFFLHLMRSHQERPTEAAAAAVDIEGLFHEVQPRFIELLDQFFPGREPELLPFALPVCGETAVLNGLCIRTEALAELRLVFIWPAGPLDRLTARERQIVYAVAHGLSFKQAARRIGIAPSTVANHLYRIYRKLGVVSRSELATLVYPNSLR